MAKRKTTAKMPKAIDPSKTVPRPEFFHDCERWALCEALEFHVDFLVESLKDADVTGEHRHYCEHVLAHCVALLEEFNGGTREVEHPVIHPTHPVQQ